MFLSGRPLRDIDSEINDIFVDHGRVKETIIDATTGYNTNVLLVGDRGAGATTMLHAIEHRYRDSTEVDTTYVDLAGMDADRAIVRLREQIAGPPHKRVGGLLEHLDEQDPEYQLLGTRQPLWTEEGTRRRHVERLVEVFDNSGYDQSLILLDAPTPGTIYSLFDQMRNDVWRINALWVVTVSADQRAAALRDPIPTFLETTIDIPPLGEDDARFLIERRVTAEAMVSLEQRGLLQAIIGTAEGNPRALITLTREALLNGPHALRELNRRRGRLDSHLNALSPAARELIQVMRGMGGVSASDPSLQARLGWSRSRISHLLAELAAANVVNTTTASDAPDGGRRRKLYTLVDELT